MLLTLTVGVLAVGSGDYPMSPVEVLRTLAGEGSPADEFIVHGLRLPRVLTALLAGAALGLSGAVFQSLVRNPLGSPDMLGFTQGAATGVLVTVLAGATTATVAGGALIGGLATGALMYALVWRRGAHGPRLVLAGIGLNALLTGVNGYLLTRAHLTEAGRAVLWLTGSVDGRGWGEVITLTVGLSVTVPAVLLAGGRTMPIMEMGDDTAGALGVPVARTRTGLLAAAVLLAGLATAAAGPVAFVALTAPQLARGLTRAPGPNLLPSLCMGAAVMVTADFAGQRLVPGHQLPVGVLTGALGGAYLLWLLVAQRRAGRL